MADGDVVPAGEGNLLSAIANPQDPMKQWGGMSGVLNLFSQRAVGQAYQNALNPDTGQIDVPTFNNAIINNPLSRLNAATALKGMGDAATAQQQATQQTLATKLQQRQALTQRLAPEIAKLDSGKDISVAEFLEKVNDAVAAGDLPPAEAANLRAKAATIPAGGNANDLTYATMFSNNTVGEMLTSLRSGITPTNVGPVTKYPNPFGIGTHPPASTDVRMGISPQTGLGILQGYFQPHDPWVHKDGTFRGGMNVEYIADQTGQDINTLLQTALKGVPGAEPLTGGAPAAPVTPENYGMATGALPGTPPAAATAPPTPPASAPPETPPAPPPPEAPPGTPPPATAPAATAPAAATGQARGGMKAGFGKNQVSLPDEFAPIYNQAGRYSGIEPLWLVAQGAVESGFKPNVTSSAGAHGVSQFMPGTASQYAVNTGDPASSIFGQAQYMHDLLQKHHGDMDAALTEYNGDKSGRGTYAKDVRAIYNQLKAESAAPPAAAPATQTPPAPQTPENPASSAPTHVGAVPVTPGGGHEMPSPDPYFAGQRQAYAAQQKSFSDLSTRTWPLQNVITTIRSDPSVPTGDAAANWTKAITNLADTMHMPVPPSWRQGTVDYQTMAKNLLQYVINQPGATQTDYELSNMLSANPSVGMMRDALQTLAAEQIGFERMKSAAFLHFNKENPDAGRNLVTQQHFIDETKDWMSKQDRMAYAADWVPANVQNGYYTHLSPALQRQFRNSLNDAKDLYRFKVIGDQ